MKTRDFHADLFSSQSPEIRSALDPLYEDFFPMGSVLGITPTGRGLQDLGDVCIRLRVPHGNAVNWYIEEKIRDARRFDTSDIAVEHLSASELGTLGWAFTHSAEFLSYVWVAPDIMPTVLLLPFPEFRRWFALCRHDYVERYSQNEGYSTAFHIIPTRDPAFTAFCEAHGARWLGTAA